MTLERNLLDFLHCHLVATCQGSENAECGESGADEQGRMETTHKRVLQSSDTR